MSTWKPARSLQFRLTAYFVSAFIVMTAIVWATLLVVRDRHLAVFGAMLGVTVVACLAWLLVGRALAPLRRIERFAEHLRSDDPDLPWGPAAPAIQSAEMVSGLNALLERIAVSFRSQDRFISDVAHELKTPLALLLSEAQVLAQTERSPSEYARFLATVQDEVRALSQVVESLLMLARAEGGTQVSMIETPINEFVMAAVERTAHIAVRAEVSVIPNLAMPSDERGTLVIRGDHALLTLAVSNLLRNAIRYAPPQTAVDLGVSSDSGKALIVVRDRGPGIPQAHLPRVFDRFYRVPDPSSTFQGVGLGLAIVKSVVDLHGGEIHVANHPEGGCRFTIQLPLGPATPTDT